MEGKIQLQIREADKIQDLKEQIDRLRGNNKRNQQSIELGHKLINLNCVIVRNIDKLFPVKNDYIKMLEQELLTSTSTSSQNRINEDINRQKYWRDKYIALKNEINDFLEDEEIPVGLTPARIRQFQHFNADKTFNGKRCVCCMDDLQVGRMLVRLDCNHVLCKICADKWFEINKSCQTCREPFY